MSAPYFKIKILFILSTIISNQNLSQSYRVKNNFDGTIDIYNPREGQKALIKGAYDAAPKFVDYGKVFLENYQKTYNNRVKNSKSSKKNISTNNNRNYIVILNQSGEGYIKKRKYDDQEQPEKIRNNPKNYSSKKTYVVKSKEQIIKERKEKLEAEEKKIEIIYKLDTNFVSNKKIEKLFISKSKSASQYWGVEVTTSSGPAKIKSIDYLDKKDGVHPKILDFKSSIIEYSDYEQKVEVYKSQNHSKIMTINDYNLLSKYYRIMNKYGEGYERIKNNNSYSFRSDVKCIKKIDSFEEKINIEWSNFDKEYLIIEYDSGKIGKYYIDSQYIKIKNSNGKVLFEAIYKNYTLKELVKELFVV